MGKHLDLLTGQYIETAKTRNKAPETAVKNAIERYLRGLNGYVRQINSGGTLRHGKWTTSGQGSGISDLLCWLPDGKFIAVEVKAQGKLKTATHAQLEFLENIINRGYVGCVADSVELVRVALSQSKAERLAAIAALKPRVRDRDPAKLQPLFP